MIQDGPPPGGFGPLPNPIARPRYVDGIAIFCCLFSFDKYLSGVSGVALFAITAGVIGVGIYIVGMGNRRRRFSTF